ncbi:hypothetical protein niasHT_029434 [Heterodera trifolii]|uniref:Uncharacterized protein n=1 Tax=Heterodera trifolii TaxID=157864 RepID=A0ABD2KQD5_9BILA
MFSSSTICLMLIIAICLSLTIAMPAAVNQINSVPLRQKRYGYGYGRYGYGRYGYGGYGYGGYGYGG